MCVTTKIRKRPELGDIVSFWRAYVTSGPLLCSLSDGHGGHGCARSP